MAQRVELADVDEDVLAESVGVATTDAAADEVTPPLTDGRQWTAARISWLQEFHRSHRDGRAGFTVEPGGPRGLRAHIDIPRTPDPPNHGCI